MHVIYVWISGTVEYMCLLVPGAGGFTILRVGLGCCLGDVMEYTLDSWCWCCFQTEGQCELVVKYMLESSYWWCHRSFYRPWVHAPAHSHLPSLGGDGSSASDRLIAHCGQRFGALACWLPFVPSDLVHLPSWPSCSLGTSIPHWQRDAISM